MNWCWHKWREKERQEVIINHVHVDGWTGQPIKVDGKNITQTKSVYIILECIKCGDLKSFRP